MRLRFACLAFLVSITLVPAQSEQDRRIATEIRTRLDTAFKLPGEIDIATRIQAALANVTEKRNERGMSANEVLRDAEYYFHGLYGASARDWAHIRPTLGAPVYNAFKWAALRCRDAGFPDLERMMRSDPENPVSEPGGSAWAYRGLKDGFRLDGKQTIGPRAAGHGLTLPALEAVVPCDPVRR
jgi:hypothetical protein